MPLAQSKHTLTEGASPPCEAGIKLGVVEMALVWQALHEDPQCPSRVLRDKVAQSPAPLQRSVRHRNRWRVTWPLSRRKGRPRRAASGPPRPSCTAVVRVTPRLSCVGIEVAQLENFKGSLWATWDREAPPFLEYLGDMKRYLDVLLDCRDGREGGSEVLGGIQKWSIPCNWKFAAENFIGDAYHNISHRSVDMVGIGPSGRGRRDDERQGTENLTISTPEGGHGALAFLQTDDLPYIPTYQANPIVEAYFKHIYEERQRRLGQEARLLGRVGTVFPHMSFLSRQPRSIAVWHPRGALKTEAWRWFLVDKDAPQEVKDFLRHYYIRYSGPGGLTEQDDMENWNYASTASKGVIARRYPYNYQMGLGYEGTHAAVPGVVTVGISEQNQRGFYKRWAEFMAAHSWADLASAGVGASARGK